MPTSDAQAYLEHDGVRVWRLALSRSLSACWAGSSLAPGSNVVVPASDSTPSDDEIWNELRRANPRVHDGPIVRVSRFDPDAARFDLALGSYRSLAVQEARRTRFITDVHDAASGGAEPSDFDPSLVWLLGVKGWVIGHDRGGAEHLLIARRGADTRIYALGWEAAPAGGVDPSSLLSPASNPRQASGNVPLHAAFLQTLQHESREELGLDLDITGATPIVVAQDSIARSYDIFVRVDMVSPIDPRKSPVCFTSHDQWEYVDAAWLARPDAAAFARSAADAITPPTRTVMRAMNWIQ